MSEQTTRYSFIVITIKNAKCYWLLSLRELMPMERQTDKAERKEARSTQKARILARPACCQMSTANLRCQHNNERRIAAGGRCVHYLLYYCCVRIPGILLLLLLDSIIIAEQQRVRRTGVQ